MATHAPGEKLVHDICHLSLIVQNMASKQQEVVEVLESWEEIDENDALDHRFQPVVTPVSSNNMNNRGPVRLIFTGDDAARTQYVPPEPTVKILRRPQNGTASQNGSEKSFQPKKTLQQREQEYAEARLRILGETPPEKTEPEKKVNSIIKSTSPNEAVTRLPKGPDGTTGFKIRR